jgi:hypothetical protein
VEKRFTITASRVNRIPLSLRDQDFVSPTLVRVFAMIERTIARAAQIRLLAGASLYKIDMADALLFASKLRQQFATLRVVVGTATSSARLVQQSEIGSSRSIVWRRLD